MNTEELFIEIVVEEYYQKDILKINLILGESFKEVVAKKEDQLIFERISTEVIMMSNIPDLLFYLSKEGFEIVNYFSFMVDDTILSKIILSQRFDTKL